MLTVRVALTDNSPFLIPFCAQHSLVQGLHPGEFILGVQCPEPAAVMRSAHNLPAHPHPPVLPCAPLPSTQGGLMWFCIPFTLATSLGLAAVALDLPITAAEAGEGLVPPAVAVYILGKSGAVWIT